MSKKLEKFKLSVPGAEHDLTAVFLVDEMGGRMNVSDLINLVLTRVTAHLNKEPCLHEPKWHSGLGMFAHECRKCGVKLKQKWESLDEKN